MKVIIKIQRHHTKKPHQQHFWKGSCQSLDEELSNAEIRTVLSPSTGSVYGSNSCFASFFFFCTLGFPAVGDIPLYSVTTVEPPCKAHPHR